MHPVKLANNSLESILCISATYPNISPGVASASKRNEYQEYFMGGKGGRCVELPTLPLSRSKCLEIWEPQITGTLRACPGLYGGGG
jgi:hypothetical protein